MSIPQVGSVNLDTQVMSHAREDKPSRPAAADIAASPGVQLAKQSTAAATDARREAAPNSSSGQIQQAVQHMNRVMKNSNSALEFSVDEGTSQVVVKVTDKETGDVIMQFPSDQSLALARYMDEVQQGKLLSQKA
jgi:flagellar protein FlaG